MDLCSSSIGTLGCLHIWDRGIHLTLHSSKLYGNFLLSTGHVRLPMTLSCWPPHPNLCTGPPLYSSPHNQVQASSCMLGFPSACSWLFYISEPVLHGWFNSEHHLWPSFFTGLASIYSLNLHSHISPPGTLSWIPLPSFTLGVVPCFFFLYDDISDVAGAV